MDSNATVTAIKPTDIGSLVRKKIPFRNTSNKVDIFEGLEGFLLAILDDRDPSVFTSTRKHLKAFTSIDPQTLSRKSIIHLFKVQLFSHLRHKAESPTEFGLKAWAVSRQGGQEVYTLVAPYCIDPNEDRFFISAPILKYLMMQEMASYQEIISRYSKPFDLDFALQAYGVDGGKFVSNNLSGWSDYNAA